MKNTQITLLATAFVVASCISTAGAWHTSHPFSVDDLLAMKRISEPQISPDAQRVVFTLRTTDLKANRGRSDLWVVSLDGSELRQLTTHPESDFHPRWHPDGRTLWFLSNRSGSTQVWRIPVDGGEARQVTQLPLDVSNLILSSDGSHLAFTLEVYPDCSTPECTQDRLDKNKGRPSTGVLYETLFVRHWDFWKDGRRSHLFVQPAGGGEAVDVMPGMDADTPSKPFGDDDEFTFTPDGNALIFAARQGGTSEAWSTDFDLYLAPIDASSPPACLTESNEAWDTAPLFSPDGQTLAYLAMTRRGYESDRFRIVLKRWPEGPARVLTEAWDRSPRQIVWSADSKTIYATAPNQGQVSLYAIATADGSVRILVEEGSVTSPSTARERVVYGLHHLRSPVELYSLSADEHHLGCLTSINSEALSNIRMGRPEPFTFAGWNGETVYAYVVKPVDFDPARKFPVAFLIHGGPQGSFGNDFHYRWNPQIYAGAGYGAVMVDFHGSIGYGQDFTDSIRNDWGGKPLEDLKAGLQAALERYPWLDGERVAGLGASYGGYMVNWIAGRWPDRFRCLVNHDGVFDMRSMYYTTEELWFPEWEHGGPYWTHSADHEKHNPARYVDRWKTPMLVIHGALDFRVPLDQAIATFTSLQRRNIPSQFLYFPDENHWVLRPKNSLQWHQTVLGWLDRWVRGD